MIGEIRDVETASIALNAAVTGHLVLATLHTNDAPTAVTRLANMGAPGYMIASALKVVLAQRLVRRICPACRRAVGQMPQEVTEAFPDLAGMTIYAGAGCENCRHTGYSGRTAVFESFVVREGIAEMIAAGATTGALGNAAVAEGLVPLQRAGLELVRAGVTTLDELYRVTRDVAERRAGSERRGDERRKDGPA